MHRRKSQSQGGREAGIRIVKISHNLTIAGHPDEKLWAVGISLLGKKSLDLFGGWGLVGLTLGRASELGPGGRRFGAGEPMRRKRQSQPRLRCLPRALIWYTNSSPTPILRSTGQYRESL